MNKYQKAILDSVDTMVKGKGNKGGGSNYFSAKVIDKLTDNSYIVANTPYYCTYENKKSCENCPFGYTRLDVLANPQKQKERIYDHTSTCVGFYKCVYSGMRPRSGLVPQIGETVQIVVKNGDFNAKFIDDVASGLGTIDGGGAGKISVFPAISLNPSVSDIAQNTALVSWTAPTDTKNYVKGYFLVYGKGSMPPYPEIDTTISIDDKTTTSNTLNGLDAETQYTLLLLCKDIQGNYVVAGSDNAIQSFTTLAYPSGGGGSGGWIYPSSDNPSETTITEGITFADDKYYVKEILLPAEFTDATWINVLIDKYGGVYLWRDSSSSGVYYYNNDTQTITQFNLTTSSPKGFRLSDGLVAIKYNDNSIQMYDKGVPLQGVGSLITSSDYVVDVEKDSSGNIFYVAQDDNDSCYVCNSAGTNLFQKDSTDGACHFSQLFTDATGTMCVSSYAWTHDEDEDGNTTYPDDGIYRYNGTGFSLLTDTYGKGSEWQKVFTDSNGNDYITHEGYDISSGDTMHYGYAIPFGFYKSKPTGELQWFGVDAKKPNTWVETSDGYLFCSSGYNKTTHRGLWFYNSDTDTFDKICDTGNGWKHAITYKDSDNNTIALVGSRFSNPYTDTSLILKYNITQGTSTLYNYSDIWSSGGFSGGQVEGFIDLGDNIRVIFGGKYGQYNYSKADGTFTKVTTVSGGLQVNSLYYNATDDCMYSLNQQYNYTADYPSQSNAYRYNTSDAYTYNIGKVGILFSDADSSDRLHMLVVGENDDDSDNET